MILFSRLRKNHAKRASFDLMLQITCQGIKLVTDPIKLKLLFLKRAHQNGWPFAEKQSLPIFWTLFVRTKGSQLALAVIILQRLFQISIAPIFVFDFLVFQQENIVQIEQLPLFLHFDQLGNAVPFFV